MKPLFELPMLLTLNGDEFSSPMSDTASPGHACSGGCAGGCCNGCEAGVGKGQPLDPGLPPI